MKEGKIIRVSGPLVVASNMSGTKMYDVVYVGDDAIVEPGGRTQRFGLDVSARFQFTNWLFADLDLNLAHPRYLDEPSGENYVPLAPTFTSIGGITLKHSSGFNGSLRYRYMKNRPANEQNTVTAWGYTVADMVINYTKQKYEVGFTIENLFNTEWNEAQFDTESRLYNEPQPVSELHFTSGTPFFIKARVSFFF
jgi:outer membrane cobalamin receptor